jgi:DNA-binding CsgD family transcriptional regulator
MHDDHLRPVERRMMRLAESGIVPAEIGRRFNRSEEFVERVLQMADRRREDASDNGHPDAGALRPLERRLLRWRAEGATYEELADRFRRGPAHLERVLALAEYKLGGSHEMSSRISRELG